MRGPIKILVTGANGQVGHALLCALRRHDASAGAHPHAGPAPSLRATGRSAGPARAQARSCGKHVGEARELVAATRSATLDDGTPCERIDLADLPGLTQALDRIAPDLVINAAAYTAVDRAEDEPDLARRINADAPAALGAWAARNQARVIHYSTDYVFDGRARRPYREDDPPHPVSAYGRSKLAGELALRDSGAPHLILRTAWVYAARGHNFLLTMLRLGAERDALRVVDDQIGAPTPARLIAEVTAQAVARWRCGDAAAAGDMAPGSVASDPASPAGATSASATTEGRLASGVAAAGALSDGVYHLVTTGQTSWCGFARAIFERAHAAGLLARVPEVHAIRTRDYPTRAARPAWSVLDTGKLQAALGVGLPDWQTALDGVMGEWAAGRAGAPRSPGAG